MLVTNLHNLPEIVTSVLGEPHRPVPYRYGATDLIGSPMQRALIYRHWDELTTDYADQLTTLVGRGGHLLLSQAVDKAVNIIGEQKFEVPLGKSVVVIKPDMFGFNHGEIVDFKFLACRSLERERTDWVRQLNIYAWALRRLGLTVNKLTIYAFLTDWRAAQARRDSKYPLIPFIEVPIDLWEPDIQNDYVAGRVRLFQMAEVGMYHPCTPEERWYTGSRWAVCKRGSSRALPGGIFDDVADADAFAGSREDEVVVTERRGVYINCESYCAARSVCPLNHDNTTT